MNKLNYFAYGSNMSSKRLRARLPSASLAGVGALRGHRLVFHKVSNHDGSGKCGIVESTRDHVLGVLYEIDADEKPVLDRIEGAGYVEKRIEIGLPSGNSRHAFTYYATHIDPRLKPYTWYLRHVLEGAREAGLPRDYIAALEQTAAIEDPETQREAKELKIYFRHGAATR
jgi:gamma-glutamylcyclotransferase (GGCT)/AIG2-like uncharacterized protein YtfP